MFVHVPIALLIQLVCWILGHLFGASARASLWIGAFAGSAVCVMREITQREYQWIEAFGQGRRKNMAWFEGMKFWEWNRHSINETLFAVAAVVLVAAAACLVVHRWTQADASSRHVLTP